MPAEEACPRWITDDDFFQYAKFPATCGKFFCKEYFLIFTDFTRVEIGVAM
jgi:hypothetical protein